MAGPGGDPAALSAKVGERVAGIARRVPRSTGDLERDLRVGPELELVDRPALERRQVGARQVDLAEGRERQGQHHVVGDDLDAGRPDRERQGVGQVAVVLDGDEPVAGLDRAARELADHAADELVVPAVDVPLLVRAVERGRRLRLERLAVAAVVVRQDVHEVERRLLLRRAAVLADDHVVAQLPERRAEPARDVLLDPVDDRQVIPVVAGLGEPGVARRPRRLADGVVEGGPGIGLPIGIEHRLGVARAVEPVRVERAGRVGGGGRGEVERQAQAAGEAQRLDVLRRDELTVLLDDLVVGEIAAQGVDAAPDAGVPLVDRRGLLPLRPEPVGAAQAGDTATDDRDPRLGRRRERRWLRAGSRSPHRHRRRPRP